MRRFWVWTLVVWRCVFSPFSPMGSLCIGRLIDNCVWMWACCEQGVWLSLSVSWDWLQPPHDPQGISLKANGWMDISKKEEHIKHLNVFFNWRSQIWSLWLIFGWTSLVSSRSATLCWVEDAGTLRTNITTLFTTWWSEEAASVMDMPAGVHLWTEDGGMSSPRPAWYAPGLLLI